MSAKQFKKNQIDTMLKHLKMALSYCNIYQDIVDLTYDPDYEVVICSYAGPGVETSIGISRPIWTLEINVACDSNSAMLMDVIKRLDAFFG